jgi:hypothetical protein
VRVDTNTNYGNLKQEDRSMRNGAPKEPLGNRGLTFFRTVKLPFALIGLGSRLVVFLLAHFQGHLTGI